MSAAKPTASEAMVTRTMMESIRASGRSARNTGRGEIIDIKHMPNSFVDGVRTLAALNVEQDAARLGGKPIHSEHDVGDMRVFILEDGAQCPDVKISTEDGKEDTINMKPLPGKIDAKTFSLAGLLVGYIGRDNSWTGCVDTKSKEFADASLTKEDLARSLKDMEDLYSKLALIGDASDMVVNSGTVGTAAMKEALQMQDDMRKAKGTFGSATLATIGQKRRRAEELIDSLATVVSNYLKRDGNWGVIGRKMKEEENEVELSQLVQALNSPSTSASLRAIVTKVIARSIIVAAARKRVQVKREGTSFERRDGTTAVGVTEHLIARGYMAEGTAVHTLFSDVHEIRLLNETDAEALQGLLTKAGFGEGLTRDKLKITLRLLSGVIIPSEERSDTAYLIFMSRFLRFFPATNDAKGFFAPTVTNASKIANKEMMNAFLWNGLALQHEWAKKLPDFMDALSASTNRDAILKGLPMSMKPLSGGAHHSAWDDDEEDEDFDSDESEHDSLEGGGKRKTKKKKKGAARKRQPAAKKGGRRPTSSTSDMRSLYGGEEDSLTAILAGSLFERE